MTKSTKSWAKPALNRLGTISEVAGNLKRAQDPGGGGSTNHSNS